MADEGSSTWPPMLWVGGNSGDEKSRLSWRRGHEHDLPLTSVDAYGQRTAKTTAAGRVPRVIEQIRTRGLATSPPWSRVRSSRCAALWGGRPEEYAASVAAGSVIAPAHR
jgi:hypothetical protein